jgi:hypothetical protein
VGLGRGGCFGNREFGCGVEETASRMERMERKSTESLREHIEPIMYLKEFACSSGSKSFSSWNTVERNSVGKRVVDVIWSCGD